LFAVEAILSKKNCINVAVRNSNPSTIPGLVAVYIDGNMQKTLPLSLSMAGDSVTGCGKRTINYVDFVYRLVP
jgi:hypothetical protein